MFRGRAERVAGRFRPLLVGSFGLAAAELVISIAAERAKVGVSLGELLASSTGGKLAGQAVALAGTAVVLAAVALAAPARAARPAQPAPIQASRR